MPYTIIRDLCSCCHQCSVACPVGAIQFRGTKYWIDPNLCVECGTCADLCHNNVIFKAGAEKKAEPHPTKERKADVVVIGGGGTGLVAAVRIAMQSSCKVVVLEKSKNLGGNAWYAGGFRVHHCKRMQEARVPDTRADEVREFLEDTLWQENPHLIKNVFDATGAFADWLFEDCGCHDDFIVGISPMGGLGRVGMLLSENNRYQGRFKRPDPTIGPGSMGSFVVLRMAELCKEYGVEILTECGATELLTDNGKITGVRARDPGGEVVVDCRACVLATGSFSRAPEILKRVNPHIYDEGEPVHFFSVPTCTGDGIRMAESIGAEIDYTNVRAMDMGPAHHPFPFVSHIISTSPFKVHFNLEGKRWGCEFGSTKYMFRKQPGRVAYAVVDSRIAEMAVLEKLESGYDGAEGAAALSNYEEKLEQEARLDTPLKKADTLEELAELMGVPVDVFVSEIQRYNMLCANKEDVDFFKRPDTLIPIEKPPYYAIYMKRFQENAMGGVVTDSETRVLDHSGAPIAGLFAGGDNARGVTLAGDVGRETVEDHVSALTWAFASGFMAGDAVIEYLGESSLDVNESVRMHE